MVDPRFGDGPPVKDGLPVADGWTEDCAEQSESLTTAMAEWMGRWFGGE